MAREKKTILAGRELQRVLASIGAGRSAFAAFCAWRRSVEARLNHEDEVAMKFAGVVEEQNVMGAVFEELRVPLYDLAMGMATDDDELIDEAMRDLGGAEGEIRSLCPK